MNINKYIENDLLEKWRSRDETAAVWGFILEALNDYEGFKSANKDNFVYFQAVSDNLNILAQIFLHEDEYKKFRDQKGYFKRF